MITVPELNKYIFHHTLSKKKSNQKNSTSCQLTWAKVFFFVLSWHGLSAAETAVMEASPDTQSEHDWFSVGSEGSESEDELLLEFGDANN